MPITQIRRRDGELVDFDRTRIETAIESAVDEVGESDKSFISVITDFIVKDLEHVYGEVFINRIPSVEDIQDIVERNLMKFNKYEVAKAYILYRAAKQEQREEKKEKLVEQFEKNKLKVTKTNGEKEYFDPEKIRAVFAIASKGYEETCTFEALMDAFKKNLVEDIKTSDIMKLLTKTCIDLVSVENISWEHIAGRFALMNLYKQACKNRNMKMDELYTPKSYLAFFKDYVNR